MTEFEQRSIISGIGQSDVGRRLGRTGLDLTIDAALEAIADAGLTTADIDGIATYPGGGMGAPAGLRRARHARGAGRAAPGAELAHRRHRGRRAARPRWSNAVLAVGAGLARHVLVYRTVTEATEQGSGGRQGIGLGGWRGRRRRPRHGRLDAVEHPVPGLLGGQLAGHERPAPLPRVRHHHRAAGDDRRSTAAATPRSTRRPSTATR